MKVDFKFLLGGIASVALGVAVMFGFGTSYFADPLNEMFFCLLTIAGGSFAIGASFEKKKKRKVTRYGDERVIMDPKGRSVKHV